MNDGRVIMHRTALPCTIFRSCAPNWPSLHVLLAGLRVSQFDWHYMLYEFACIKLHVVIATWPTLEIRCNEGQFGAKTRDYV